MSEKDIDELVEHFVNIGNGFENVNKNVKIANKEINSYLQPIEIKIVNKIKEQVELYQKNTGASKVWIAMKMGYNSPQAFDKATKNNSNSVETYAKFAYFLGCKPHDLYTVEIINKNSL